MSVDRRFCQWCGQFLLEEGQSLKYAGFGRRLGAYAIDFIAPYVVLVIALSAAAAADSPGAVAGLFFLIILGWLALQLYFWSQGTSFGKNVLAARVIHSDGRPVGFWTMVVRELVAKGIVGSIVAVFTLGIGWLLWYLWALWDKDSQALHDKFVSSLVVYS